MRESGQSRARGGQALVEFALLLPIMLIILLAIVDLARVYTSMVSVESAAREAADFGTERGAPPWQAGPVLEATVAEMERRACIAARNLRDYEGDSSTCTNPSFACTITAPDYPTPGSATTYTPCQSLDEAAACDDPLRAQPCRVTVTLGFRFTLLAPFDIDFFGVRLGLPTQLSFARDSTFAITDSTLNATPGPTPPPPTPTPTATSSVGPSPSPSAVLGGLRGLL